MKELRKLPGLTWDMLKNKPKFAQIVDGLIAFIGDAKLIIHNAPFDLGFLEHEFNSIKHAWGKKMQNLEVIDTLLMAREIHPGQRNSLDALCKRYNIDNSHRNYHGALLDSQILAQVYLAMTAGQTSLDLAATTSEHNAVFNNVSAVKQQPIRAYNLKIIQANTQEQAEHAAMLALLDKQKK